MSNRGMKLEALIDTGSPVSLMRHSIYDKYFANKELFKLRIRCFCVA